MPRLRPWQWHTLHLLLFVLTVFACILAGTELRTGRSWWGELNWSELSLGVPYAIAFLLFLSCHEFGHYFTARHHHIRTTLPFYIPMFIPGIFNIGSMGAVIALRQAPRNNREYFDVGISGPLAGMVAAILILVVAVLTLPEPNGFLLATFPEWAELFGGIPAESTYAEYLISQQDAAIATGPTLLMRGIWQLGLPHLPPEYLLIHYPLLFAAYLSLFATALNLLPIGQLDGGHIVYAMFGPRVAGIVSRIAVLILLLIGGTALVDLRPDHWTGWLSLAAYAAYLGYIFFKILNQQPAWRVILVSFLFLLVQSILFVLLPPIEPQFIWLLYSILMVRVVKLDHPPAYQFAPLNRVRMGLGWLAFLIFLLCFSPMPLRVIGLIEMQIGL
ncbi:MAG: site-2 protease family protein [Bacteroidota bacterium]